MSNIVDSHVENGKPRRGKRVSQSNLDEYDRVSRLIEEVTCDLVNGVMRSEIFSKFHNRQYENLGKKDIGDRQIQNYIKAAWEIMREDRVEKVQELRDLLFSQYMSQYNEATMSGNVLAAKACLDSIAKIFLPDEKTLSIKGKSDGDITLNFTFSE